MIFKYRTCLKTLINKLIWFYLSAKFQLNKLFKLNQEPAKSQSELFVITYLLWPINSQDNASSLPLSACPYPCNKCDLLLCTTPSVPNNCLSTISIVWSGCKCSLFDNKCGQCREMCCWGLLTAASAAMHTNYVLEEVSVPQTLSFSLYISCLWSRTGSWIFLNIALTCFPRRHRERKVENHVNSSCMAGTKGGVGWGGVVIHLFHSLLRAVLKDLPTLSAQAFS